MAGDWIKMRSNLWTDPRVTGLADQLDIGEATIIGALYLFWSIADQHSVAGELQGMSPKSLDRRTGVPGLGDALVGIGWLIETADGIAVPDFEKHNSASAKRRAQDASRKAKSRKKPGQSAADKNSTPSATSPGDVRNVSASDADRNGTPCGARERERVREREEIKTPPPPSSSATEPDRSEVSSDWRKAVAVELVELGISDTRCITAAVNGGLLEADVRAIIGYYREHHQSKGWAPQALHYRLRTNGFSGIPPDQGWPQPSQSAIKAEKQEAQRQQQLTKAEAAEKRRQLKEQQQAEAQRREQELESRFGKDLDRMDPEEWCALARQIAPFVEKQIKRDGHVRNKGVRKQMLRKMSELEEGDST